MYVVIEGIDTAGKSTQLEILKNKFPNAIFTKEPGGTALGIKLREMILSGEANSSLAEMFMFLADRAEHTQEIILKNKNKLIISDRSFISGRNINISAKLLFASPLKIISLSFIPSAVPPGSFVKIAFGNLFFKISN
jgi:dTMP kinase